MNVDRFSASPRTDTTINRYPNDSKIHTASHARASTKAGLDRRSTKHLLVARSWLVLHFLLMGGCIGNAGPEARLMVGEPVIATREKRSLTG